MDRDPCPLCGSLPCDWVDDPHKAEVGLCWTLAKIREVTGLGANPMMDELPGAITALLTAQQAENERLARNLRGRDSFLVERGMWHDFVDAITTGGTNDAEG